VFILVPEFDNRKVLPPGKPFSTRRLTGDKWCFVLTTRRQLRERLAGLLQDRVVVEFGLITADCHIDIAWIHLDPATDATLALASDQCHLLAHGKNCVTARKLVEADNRILWRPNATSATGYRRIDDVKEVEKCSAAGKSRVCAKGSDGAVSRQGGQRRS
jgi:hypothetical protein